MILNTRATSGCSSSPCRRSSTGPSISIFSSRRSWISRRRRLAAVQNSASIEDSARSVAAVVSDDGTWSCSETPAFAIIGPAVAVELDGSLMARCVTSTRSGKELPSEIELQRKSQLTNSLSSTKGRYVLSCPEGSRDRSALVNSPNQDDRMTGKPYKFRHRFHGLPCGWPRSSGYSLSWMEFEVCILILLQSRWPVCRIRSATSAFSCRARRKSIGSLPVQSTAFGLHDLYLSAGIFVPPTKVVRRWLCL